MNSWDTTEPGRIARARATRLFCDWLDDKNHDQDRKACTLPKPTPAEEDAASDAAKALFARLGQFDLEDATHPAPPAIPAKTKFRIYEVDGRDALVTMVLPPLGKIPEPFVAMDVYLCTYWPYL